MGYGATPNGHPVLLLAVMATQGLIRASLADEFQSPFIAGTLRAQYETKKEAGRKAVLE